MNETIPQKPAFTDSNWEIVKDQDSDPVIVAKRPGTDYGFTVAETFGYKQEREANAKLIVQAPALYRLVKQEYDTLNSSKYRSVEEEERLEQLNLVLNKII